MVTGAQKEVVTEDGYMGEIWCGDQGVQMDRVSVIPVDGQVASTLRYMKSEKIWWNKKWVDPSCFVHEWDIRHIFEHVKTTAKAKRRRTACEGAEMAEVHDVHNLEG